jgi:hypothetical protein
VHGAAVPHSPVESQLSTPLFEHRFEPGVQTPEQAPMMQA